jgi:hypothetical protein
MKIDERPNQRERRRMMDDDVMGHHQMEKDEGRMCNSRHVEVQ